MNARVVEGGGSGALKPELGLRPKSLVSLSRIKDFSDLV